MGITVWDPSRKVNHLTSSISSTRIDKSVLVMDVKVSKDLRKVKHLRSFEIEKL